MQQTISESRNKGALGLTTKARVVLALRELERQWDELLPWEQQIASGIVLNLAKQYRRPR